MRHQERVFVAAYLTAVGFTGLLFAFSLIALLTTGRVVLAFDTIHENALEAAMLASMLLIFVAYLPAFQRAVRK
jgi:TRAP-type C4-dicarboxylate transport system permease small subunit